MFWNIVGSLLVAWFLNLFGFYQNIFYGFVQPMVSFDVTIGFYYGAFVALGLIAWFIQTITRPRTGSN